MLLYVVSLGFALFAASGKTTGTRKRSIFGEPQLDKAGDSRRQLMDQDLAIGEDVTTTTTMTTTPAPVVPFKVEFCRVYDGFRNEIVSRVLIHYRVGDTLDTDLLTLDDNFDIQKKERDTCNGCDLVAVDGRGRLWKSRSVIGATVMDPTNPCPTASVPIRSQSMLMSPEGDFVVFFFEHSLFAELYDIHKAEKHLLELEAFPLLAVNFRGGGNFVWVALTNGNVVGVSYLTALHKTVPGADQIAVFRMSSKRRIAYMRALRERSIYVCELDGDKCKELRTEGLVVADFQWHGDDQILCRTVTGSMFVWNVAELLYKELEGVEFEDVSAFATDSVRVFIAHSDTNFIMRPVPDITWTQDGAFSVGRAPARRVAYFARHPQAEHNTGDVWGFVAFFFANAKVTPEGLQQLRELRDGMRALTVDETADKQVYGELHDASNVYVATSPLVRAVWAALYALDGICDGQITENYTVHIHGALQENPPAHKTTAADFCGVTQTIWGVEEAAKAGFGDAVATDIEQVTDSQRMLDTVRLNEDYNVGGEYNAKQLLSEVRDSQAADGKVLFAAGHSQWFKHFLNDDKVKLDAASQQFRDELNTNQSGKLHNCQVARFEYEVAADGSIQMWDCLSVFTPDTQTR